MKTWRLLETGDNDCFSNMAIDEALLQDFTACCSIPVLRIYRWNPAALSIGFSQNPIQDLDLSACKRRNISFVRRMTGGGVIFHDDELTYSIVCSENDLAGRCFAKQTYMLLCSFIIKAYRSMGLDAGFALTGKRPPEAGWACFKQMERYDIVVNGKKIGGNAQKRKKGLIFQHGSIPLGPGVDKVLEFLQDKTDFISEKACSLSYAMGKDISYENLKKILVDSFEKSFHIRLSESNLSSTERLSAEHLLKFKYNTKEWNLYRHENKDKACVA
jgi:lipoyl(octanoyl) transferase